MCSFTPPSLKSDHTDTAEPAGSGEEGVSGLHLSFFSQSFSFKKKNKKTLWSDVVVEEGERSMWSSVVD